MDELPELMAREGIEEVVLDPGKPPIAISQGQRRFLDAPLVNTSNATELLRSLSNEEQQLQLDLNGTVEFDSVGPNRPPFHVRAIRHGESISLELKALSLPARA